MKPVNQCKTIVECCYVYVAHSWLVDPLVEASQGTCKQKSALYLRPFELYYFLAYYMRTDRQIVDARYHWLNDRHAKC